MSENTPRQGSFAADVARMEMGVAGHLAVASMVGRRARSGWWLLQANIMQRKAQLMARRPK